MSEVENFLSEWEAALIDALVNFTGEQKAALLREMLLEQARMVLIGDSNCGLDGHENEGHEKSLLSA